MSFPPFILLCLTVISLRADAAVQSVVPCNIALYLHSQSPRYLARCVIYIQYIYIYIYIYTNHATMFYSQNMVEKQNN